MYRIITQEEFIKEFKEIRPNNFSHEGLIALYEYLTEVEEEEHDNDIEFDVIAICCDYTEYESLEEIKKQYKNIETFEDLTEYTWVIQIPNTERLIIFNF
jgi:hypothetical protein